MLTVVEKYHLTYFYYRITQITVWKIRNEIKIQIKALSIISLYMYRYEKKRNIEQNNIYYNMQMKGNK